MCDVQNSYLLLIIIVLTISLRIQSIATIEMIKPITDASYAISKESLPIRTTVYKNLGFTLPHRETKMFTTIFYTYDGNPLQTVTESSLGYYDYRTPPIYNTRDFYLDLEAPKPRPLFFRLNKIPKAGSLMLRFYDKHGNEIVRESIGFDDKELIKEQLDQEKIVVQERMSTEHLRQMYILLSNHDPKKYRSLDLSIVRPDPTYRGEDIESIANRLFFLGILGGAIMSSTPLLIVGAIAGGVSYMLDGIRYRNLPPEKSMADGIRYRNIKPE